MRPAMSATAWVMWPTHAAAAALPVCTRRAYTSQYSSYELKHCGEMLPTICAAIWAATCSPIPAIPVTMLDQSACRAAAGSEA
jgi:hypothetical protein